MAQSSTAITFTASLAALTHTVTLTSGARVCLVSPLSVTVTASALESPAQCFDRVVNMTTVHDCGRPA